MEENSHLKNDQWAKIVLLSKISGLNDLRGLRIDIAIFSHWKYWQTLSKIIFGQFTLKYEATVDYPCIYDTNTILRGPISKL